MKSILQISIVILIGQHCMAQSALPVKKISIFKNSTSMIVKEGTVAVNAGKAAIPVPTRAIYGTYFLGTTKENSIKNIIIKNDTVKRPEQIRAIWDLVAANVGKQATLSFSPAQKIDKTISGKILEYNQQSGLTTVLQDNGKVSAFHSTDLYFIEVSENNGKTYMADSIQRSLLLYPTHKCENIALEEIYLQTGMNWIPSYFLKLKDENTAHLEMKATIENFADAIADAETELIVGEPQMTYSDKFDPMTYDYQTPDIQGYSSTAKHSISTATYEESPSFESSYSTDGDKNNDMYIYRIGKISLVKNSKGIYPIFAGSIECKDKYEGEIPDKNGYANSRSIDNSETTYDLYHSLEIKNSTSMPLTSAPITIINSKEQFMSQDKLAYTPIGATTNIRLSKAIDIIMKNMEEESKRTDKAKQIGKQVYSSIILKGTISLENFQTKEVNVTITKGLNGGASTASDGGKISKQKGSADVNPYSQIKWDVKLSPTQKRTVNYEYEVFFTP